ncbi:MAG: hypothetical protein DRJ33_05880 [Candidatus Methanomethylicota archaeon]|uniref:Copper resistance protein D domain-containing protein n=1 Tax=Thermoproteota archaeon TaxID=2056631 RepID=A0A497EWA7_9CREN|nr:MAG: hypothetical protein DRJ33_05880 [Candidatus Verstraetearchaeota archaeon]
MKNLLLYAITSGLHDLAATIWIGAVLTNALVLTPTFKKPMEDEKLKKQLMMRVQRKLASLIPLSIVVVVITGVILARPSQAFHGFFSFTNTYSTILTAKAVLTAAMAMMIRQAIIKSLQSRKASIKAEKASTALVTL